MTPVRSSFSRRIASASYAPSRVVLAHSSAGSWAPTTNFSVSLKNGAPGSSSTVRSRHAGANISWVRRPSRIVSDCSVIAPMVSPIFGSKPNSKVQLGDSKTPSAEMNSWTAMVAMVVSSRVVVCLSTCPRTERVDYDTAPESPSSKSGGTSAAGGLTALGRVGAGGGTAARLVLICGA